MHLRPVYQRGWVINSQLVQCHHERIVSISKGMGDQFSAKAHLIHEVCQYIKGDG